MNKTYLIKSSNVFYYSGSAARDKGYKFNAQTHFIEINSIDYERYRQTSTDTIVDIDNYIVFLDQYMPFHPDNIITGNKIIDFKTYYRKLNDFFSEIELFYNMQVVIAAHPKAIRYNNVDFFEGRQVRMSSTANLVKHSKAVIAHFSTAISFPVLYYKKIFFVSMREFKIVNMHLYKTIDLIAHSLESDLLFLDETINFKNDLSCNKEKYDEYKYAYLTNSESEHRSNADCLIDSFKLL